jgi:hypothetical protein
MVTVRELEHELNVSRVSLYALLKKEQFRAHVVKDNNVIMVDDAGAEMLRRYYLNKIKGGTPRRGVLSAAVNADGDESGYISILQSQLAKKDEQIDSLLNIVSRNGIAH